MGNVESFRMQEFHLSGKTLALESCLTSCDLKDTDILFSHSVIKGKCILKHIVSPEYITLQKAFEIMFNTMTYFIIFTNIFLVEHFKWFIAYCVQFF